MKLSEAVNQRAQVASEEALEVGFAVPRELDVSYFDHFVLLARLLGLPLVYRRVKDLLALLRAVLLFHCAFRFGGGSFLTAELLVILTQRHLRLLLHLPRPSMRAQKSRSMGREAYS